MDADFVSGLGLPFLAHRLRRASELLVHGYEKWLPEVGVTAPPRSLSTLLLLRKEGVLSVTDIAERLRFTHPLIITLLKRLEDLGLTEVTRDPQDGRRRLIALTAKGVGEAALVEEATTIMGHAYADLFSEIEVDLLGAIARLEEAGKRLSFDARLRARVPAGDNRPAKPDAA